MALAVDAYHVYYASAAVWTIAFAVTLAGAAQMAQGRAEFARCLPENSSMSYAIMKGLVQRLRQADRKIESLALMDVYGRVARALLEFAQPDREGLMTIRERISRQDIAKMVGASREMVSRVMKDLEDRGFIETREDGSMLVKDRLTTLG